MLVTVVAVVALAATESPPAPRDCSAETHFTPFSVDNPVCGSDGVTYKNLPHLEYTACVNNQSESIIRFLGF